MEVNMKKRRIVLPYRLNVSDGTESNMISVIRAERLKMRHTFGGILPAAAAVLTLGIVLGLAYKNKYYSVNAWNWWYVMLLPGMLATLCYLGMKKEKKTHYCNLFSSPVSPGKYLAGKICFYATGLCAANLLIAAGTFAADIFWGGGNYIPIGNEFAAAVVLSVCFLWKIPLFMLLGARFGIFVSLFLCMALSMGGTLLAADFDLWWLCPSAVPVRLMCPVLGIMPNGLLVPADSMLLDVRVIVPGILICVVWFVICTGILLLYFREQ